MTTTYTLDVAAGLSMTLAETTNGVATRYWQGMDTLAQSTGATTRYLGYDGLGSARQMTNGATLTLNQTFDLYGNAFSKSGSVSVPTNVGFTGETSDASGLSYLRARYYSPSMGRFLNIDPSRMEANLYAYVGGNPISRVDPSGHCYSWLTPMRDLAPEWCHNIDNANDTIVDAMWGNATVGEGIGAAAYVYYSGVAVGVPLGLAASSCVAISFYGGPCVQNVVGGALISGGIATLRTEMAKQSDHPELQAWVEQDSESFFWNSVWLGGIGGSVLGPVSNLGAAGKISLGVGGLVPSGLAVAGAGSNMYEYGYDPVYAVDGLLGLAGGLASFQYGIRPGISQLLQDPAIEFYLRTGISPRMYRALMATLEENLGGRVGIAMDERAVGASLFDEVGLTTKTPEHGYDTWKLPFGLRWSWSKLRLVSSDWDIAAVWNLETGEPILSKPGSINPQDVWLQVRSGVNSRYGLQLIHHGDNVSGRMWLSPGATNLLFGDRVHIFLPGEGYAGSIRYGFIYEWIMSHSGGTVLP